MCGSVQFLNISVSIFLVSVLERGHHCHLSFAIVKEGVENGSYVVHCQTHLREREGGREKKEENIRAISEDEVVPFVSEFPPEGPSLERGGQTKSGERERDGKRESKREGRDGKRERRDGVRGPTTHLTDP